jgi:hypothetical protein
LNYGRILNNVRVQDSRFEGLAFETLEVAKLAEEHIKRQRKGGFGSKADLERARYARLSLEVELLRAKQTDKT